MMKTYLSDQEFVDLFWNSYQGKMRVVYNAGATDRILWSMFQTYEKDVKDSLKGCMWDIAKFTGENAIDCIGYQFHKSFRQVDVIPAKHIDGIVWTCMQDAPIFWKCLEKACKILASKDAAEVYKEDCINERTN